VRIHKLVLITGNKGKLIEFEKLIDIKNLDFTSESMEIEEIQSFSMEEIGNFKIHSVLSNIDNKTGIEAVMTDDTGLFCDALKGLPGPFIKWFLDRMGAEGIYELTENRSVAAKAVCQLSLGLVKTEQVFHFKGEVEGQLVPPKGEGGFGWDKIFKPDGYEKTYGEMHSSEKNTISHRTLAVNHLRQWILDN
jgi:XTP/dITP diphosphohydrolase